MKTFETRPHEKLELQFLEHPISIPLRKTKTQWLLSALLHLHYASGRAQYSVHGLLSFLAYRAGVGFFCFSSKGGLFGDRTIQPIQVENIRELPQNTNLSFSGGVRQS